MQAGQKGTTVVFYKSLGTPSANESSDESEKRPRFVARASKVFNADQVEGFVAPPSPTRSLVEIIQSADQLVSSTGAVIRHGGDSAFYTSKDDYIAMPEKERFVGTKTSGATESYYAVLFHELTH